MQLPRLACFAIPLALLAACGSSASPSPTASASSPPRSVAAKPSVAASQAAAKPSGPAVFKVGDPVKAGDLQLTVTKVDAPFKSSNQFITPKNGQFLVVSVALQNTGSKAASVSSMLSFELRDDAGQSYAETLVPDAPKPPDGEIAAGDKLAGALSFDVPAGKKYRLYFKNSLFSSGQAIIDLSASTPTASASVPTSAAAKPAAGNSASAKPASGPSAFKVGDAVKAGDLQLMVTKVEAPFKSGTEFIQPKNGEFLVATVVLQNTGGKATAVSSMLSFELRDDAGQSYTETIVPDAPKPPDGDIAAGDKLAGALSFDVPKGKDYRLYFKNSLFTAGQAIIDLGTH